MVAKTHHPHNGHDKNRRRESQHVFLFFFFLFLFCNSRYVFQMVAKTHHRHNGHDKNLRCESQLVMRITAGDRWRCKRWSKVIFPASADKHQRLGSLFWCWQRHITDIVVMLEISILITVCSFIHWQWYLTIVHFSQLYWVIYQTTICLTIFHICLKTSIVKITLLFTTTLLVTSALASPIVHICIKTIIVNITLLSITIIPFICHRHHRRCLCKKKLPGGNWQKLAKIWRSSV